MITETQGTGLFTDLQQRIAQRIIDALPTQAGACVLSEDKKDLFTEIQKRISKPGFLILVMTPNVSQGENPLQIKCEVVCQVTENVVRNRADGGTGMRGMDACAYIIAALQDPEWETEPWTDFEFQTSAMVDEDSTNNEVVWLVTFVTYTILALGEGFSGVTSTEEPCAVEE